MLVENPCHYIVVMRLRNLRAIKGAGHQRLVRAEVVDKDSTVDLGGVEWGAALPEEVGFFRRSLDKEVDLAANPGSF